MSTTLCPCGSKKNYSQCCESVHQNHANADHPEKLMRSRYSAHVIGLIDFIVDTYHSSCEAESHRDAIAQSVNSTWLQLDVISSSVDTNGKQGYVEFKANYIEDEKQYCLHEKSRFVTETKDGKAYWYYIDGEYPHVDKIGRNDLCPCSSGKKYKKCCG